MITIEIVRRFELDEFEKTNQKYDMTDEEIQEMLDEKIVGEDGVSELKGCGNTIILSEELKNGTVTIDICRVEKRWKGKIPNARQ